MASSTRHRESTFCLDVVCTIPRRARSPHSHLKTSARRVELFPEDEMDSSAEGSRKLPLLSLRNSDDSKCIESTLYPPICRPQTRRDEERELPRRNAGKAPQLRGNQLRQEFFEKCR